MSVNFSKSRYFGLCIYIHFCEKGSNAQKKNVKNLRLRVRYTGPHVWWTVGLSLKTVSSASSFRAWQGHEVLERMWVVDSVVGI